MLKLLAKGIKGTGRMAGDVFKRGLEMQPGGKVGLGEVVDRLSFDAIFGLMNAATTPGDIGDKLIAGTLTTAGGGLGGVVLSGALPGNMRFNRFVRPITELAGGIAGDQLSYGATDAVLRMKSPDGMSPNDRQTLAYNQQMEAEFAKKYGVKLKNVDPMLYEQGLGGG